MSDVADSQHISSAATFQPFSLVLGLSSRFTGTQGPFPHLLPTLPLAFPVLLAPGSLSLWVSDRKRWKGGRALDTVSKQVNYDLD